MVPEEGAMPRDCWSRKRPEHSLWHHASCNLATHGEARMASGPSYAGFCTSVRYLLTMTSFTQGVALLDKSLVGCLSTYCLLMACEKDY
jgi:hypothetical protein